MFAGWPSTSAQPQVARIPSIALHTEQPWYDPAKEISPTSHWSDLTFLRYATILLWLTVCITGLGMELVLGEPLVRWLVSQSHERAKQANCKHCCHLDVLMMLTLPIALIAAASHAPASALLDS